MLTAQTMFLAAATAYAGFQWTVHVVIYPQFAAVPHDRWPEYERLHQRRISLVVGPLFVAIVLSAGWLVIDAIARNMLWPSVFAALLVVAILGITAFGAVPQHRRLSEVWDDAAYQALLRIDLIRTLAASLVVIVAVLILAFG